jgi:Fungal specific transcription factor domain
MDTIGCSTEVLDLIAKACNLALERGDPARNSSKHSEALDYVEWKLTYAKQKLHQENESHDSLSRACAEGIAELYRTAGLIYLLRAGRGRASSTPLIRRAVETSLKIAAELMTCPRAFPIVILGCEARLDDERLIILDLFRRTQGCRKIASIAGAQQIIEASWAQDDLRPEEDLDYIKKLDVVLSASKEAPSFA